LDLGLADKTVVITGGSAGIGRACAEAFAAEGATVAIIARTESNLQKVAKEIADLSGRTVLARAGDMGRPEDVERIFPELIDELGHVDVLVTCAGSSPGGLIEDLTEEQWFSSLNLKFMGYVRSMRAVLPGMRERRRGAIVLVVGNDGLKPSYWETTAGAANAADINVAASMAEQYGRYGVRVNTVNPGPVNTDRWDGLEKAFARDKGVSQQHAHELAVSSIPLGRICEAHEVANLVVFLASDRASFINGAHIPIDGSQRKAIMDM
jgi:NAD(P)-dependent dehydrogenase (short-subunit alcohol dehydrogenase family)